MNVNELLSESLFFGMIVSLLAYKIGFELSFEYSYHSFSSFSPSFAENKDSYSPRFFKLGTGLS